MYLKGRGEYVFKEKRDKGNKEKSGWSAEMQMVMEK